MSLYYCFEFIARPTIRRISGRFQDVYFVVFSGTKSGDKISNIANRIAALQIWLPPHLQQLLCSQTNTEKTASNPPKAKLITCPVFRRGSLTTSSSLG
jgi:hypothetical protein